MARAIKKPMNATPPYGAELWAALQMIEEGKSDAAIAASLSAARPHGQFRIDPASIADLRNGR